MKRLIIVILCLLVSVCLIGCSTNVIHISTKEKIENGSQEIVIDEPLKHVWRKA